MKCHEAGKSTTGACAILINLSDTNCDRIHPIHHLHAHFYLLESNLHNYVHISIPDFMFSHLSGSFFGGALFDACTTFTCVAMICTTMRTFKFLPFGIFTIGWTFFLYI